MTEKRTPHYPLSTVKSAFALPSRLQRTFSAAEGAEALGMDDADVMAVIQALSESDFVKSMTSYADPMIWQDVYKPTTRGSRLYVKFTLNARKDLLLISFKAA